MINEFRIQLTQKQNEFDKLIKTTENVLFGGARGGGKSHGLREIMLKRRIEIPNSYGVIFRKTYPELYGNHISPLLKKFPVLRGLYNQQNKEIRFWNGSVLAFRHCQYEKDLGLHQGQEYHDLAIEEVGEWPEDWFWTLKGSNRSSIQGIKPRCLLTGNPGGVGHKWLKRLFIERQFREMEHSGQYAFIPSMVSDNPALIKNDPGYVDRLKANKNPLLVKAYLEGSWDIQAGQFFEDVSRETHLVDPFEIPHHWRRFGGFDTGFNHPAAFGWYAVDEDGVVYKYRELCEPGLRTEELVKNRIAIHEDTFKLQTIEAGPDCWNKHASGPSVEEKFAEASGRKLYLTRANNDRIPGWGQLRDYLALREGGPLFRIFKTCPMTFDAIVRATHDTKKPEDVLKVDAVEGDPYTGDDLLDETRYALMSRPRASIPIKKEVRDRYAVKSKRVTDWKTV